VRNRLGIGCALALVVVALTVPAAATAHPGKRFPGYATSFIQHSLADSGQWSSVSCRLTDQARHISCAVTAKGTGRKGTMTEHCVAGGVLAVLSDRHGVISKSVLPLHVCR
jgi:hypothetical protein